MHKNGASHEWGENVEDTSQVRDHAKIPSTVTERPAPGEKEQMEFRVK